MNTPNLETGEGVSPNGTQDERFSQIANHFVEGEIHFVGFVESEDLHDLECAIAEWESALSLTSDGDPVKPVLLTCASIALSLRFAARRETADIDRLTSLLGRANMLTPDEGFSSMDFLDHLDIGFIMKLLCLDELADVDHVRVILQSDPELVSDFSNPQKIKAVMLSNLGRALLLQFNYKNNLENTGILDDSITTLQAAASIAEHDIVKKINLLNDIGDAFVLRFQLDYKASDIHDAIAVYTNGYVAALDNVECKDEVILHLKRALDTLYHSKEILSSYDELPDFATGAECIVDDRYRELKFHWLYTAGVVQWNHYMHNNMPGTCDRAILALSEAKELLPNSDYRKALALRAIGSLFESRYKHLDHEGDLDGAISAMSDVMEVEFKFDDQADYCVRLAALLQSRFKRSSNPVDIDSAITCYMLAMGSDHSTDSDDHAGAPPRDNMHRAEMLELISIALVSRFNVYHGMEDINRAVSNCRLALDSLPNDHSDRFPSLINLGNCLYGRFGITRKSDDIEASIEAYKNARTSGIVLKSKGLDTALIALGQALQARFSAFGEVHDLDAAISYAEESIGVAREDHKAMVLEFSGNAYKNRYGCLFFIADLNMATMYMRQAIDLTESTHQEKVELPMLLSHYGQLLAMRVERLGSESEFDQSIRVQKRAIDMMSDNHEGKAILLRNLGSTYLVRNRDMADADTALAYLEKGVAIAYIHGSEVKRIALTALGKAWHYKFKHSKRADDLEPAISAFRQADDLGVTSPEIRLYLGEAFEERYGNTLDKSDLVSALGYYRGVVEARASSIVNVEQCLSCSMKCASLQAELYGIESAFRDYEAVVELINSWKYAMFGQPVRHWYTKLRINRNRIDSISSAVFSAAISTGDHAKAVEWFEAVRGMVWGHLVRLQTSFEELRTKDKKLADELDSIAQHLKTDGLMNPFLGGESEDFRSLFSSRSRYNRAYTRVEAEADNSAPGNDTQEQRAMRLLEEDGVSTLDSEALKVSRRNTNEIQDRRAMAFRYDELVKRARKIDGFENLAMPRSFDELARTTRDDCIVVIVNIGKLRCDAIAICPSKNVIHIPLPEETFRNISNFHAHLANSLRREGIRMRGSRRAEVDEGDGNMHLMHVLAHLWAAIVQPILKSIEDELWTITIDHLPHVIWCPVGPLTFLPLHAAGIYNSEESISVSDFIVSSYTPSLSALMTAEPSTSKPSSSPPSILVIAQPNTPGQTPLPETTKEADIVESHFPSNGRVRKLVGPEAISSAVFYEMPRHRWVHFACHGHQSPTDPLESAFVLYDVDLSLHRMMTTTPAELMKQVLQMSGETSLINEAEQAELAVLTACQTATGDEALSGEGAHLTAGMFSCGYKNVVGTMWSIKDADGPIFADAFYAYLLSDNDGQGKDGKLRVAHALHHATRVLKESVGEKELLRWVPFVHFGSS